MPRSIEESAKGTTTTTCTTARLLTRAETAKAMRCSESTVRHLEGDVLTPQVGSDGVHKFQVAEAVAATALRADEIADDRRDIGDAREIMTTLG